MNLPRFLPKCGTVWLVVCGLALVCAGRLHAGDAELERRKQAEEQRRKEAELRRKEQDEFWQQADKAANENRLDDALRLCEEFFRVGWDRQDRWYWNQRRIVDLLDRANRLDDALRAARIMYDATPDPRSSTDCVRRIMQLLKKLDENDVTRCNAFLDYQMNGPAGPDGKAGTPDDLKNPMEDFAYPICTDRIQSLKEAWAQVSDDSEGSRTRAHICLYTARPKEALRYFVEACQRSRLEQYPIHAREVIWLGVRPLRGHGVGMAQDFAFISQGRAGADGKPGTADDLTDPVAPFLDGAPDANAGLPAEQVAALKELLAELRLLAEDQREPGERRYAVAAMLRIHEALNDWALAEVKAWFLDQMAVDHDGGVQQEYMRGAFIALREGAWHVGGLDPLLDELEEQYAVLELPSSREVQNQRNWFSRHLAHHIWKDATVPKLKPEPKPKEPKKK